MLKPSDRAFAIALRTYHRPVHEDELLLETWDQVVERVIGHQRWLWERAVERQLNNREEQELKELKSLILERKILPAGRTLWLGGTKLSQKRESSMFNCAFTYVETVYDVVDLFWLLLQGCGVGFKPIIGTLNGFRKPLHSIEIVPSARKDSQGCETNSEMYDSQSEIWTIQVGDSAEAWAKAVGKLVAGKFPAKKLILDFTALRPAGSRLKGYGWISPGFRPLSQALKKIAELLSLRSDQLLSRMDILDLVNHLGTVLASRRSAQMALFDYGEPEWEEFASAKKEWWLKDHVHRQQSNNSLLFHAKPSKEELEKIFQVMSDSGGSEPGLINVIEAERRAPWFKGCNPCAEILLGNKCFCNLSEVNLTTFVNDKLGFKNALILAARMNYRQTLVNLHDEILQEAWHLNNEFLHLCGVSLTGIRACPEHSQEDFRNWRSIAVKAACDMAIELNSPLPKNVTCVKPSGTLSKIMGTTLQEVPEGIHLPLGKYILNSITFSKFDPLVKRFEDAGYEVIDKPYEEQSVLVKFPVAYEHLPFTKVQKQYNDGTWEEMEINQESAVEQLDWYVYIQKNWSQQNVSVTISYDPEEVPNIISWLLDHWDEYVGVSFLLRNDPTKSPQELGFAYLPQEVITKKAYDEYLKRLKPVDFSNISLASNAFPEGCEGQSCILEC